MTYDEEVAVAKKLGTQIVKDANGARVKFGKTNGKPCLHIMFDRKASTIYDASEWERHPFNNVGRKKQKRDKREELDELAVTHV